MKASCHFNSRRSALLLPGIDHFMTCDLRSESRDRGPDADVIQNYCIKRPVSHKIATGWATMGMKTAKCDRCGEVTYTHDSLGQKK